MAQKDWRNTLVHSGATIREALAAIERGAMQMALVVDERGRLCGMLTDGDVRRGILRGLTLDAPVENVMNPHPHTVPPGMSRPAMLRLMADFKVQQIPVVDSDGSLIGVERITELIETPVEDTWIVLMAGGLGSRLRPLTDTLPKPLIPVGGRPLLESIVNGLAEQGFRRFFFAVNYKAELFREHFGDGRKFGVSIEYLHEHERKGTAGALSLLPERPQRPFIVMNADLLTTISLRQMLDFHCEHNAAATMCVREYGVEIPYGVVETDQHRLTGLVEKPLRTVLVNAGIYALSEDTVDIIPSDRMYDMTQLFSDLIALNRQAIVFPVHEYWLDIGRSEDLERANLEYQKVFK